MVDIQLRGELWDNDSADVLRWWGFRDITAPMDIQAALDAAAGDDVTLLINSPGGDMAVGNEIRSMLRRYSGATTALFQGMGASAATLAASGCRVIQSEPGALLCYHNPMGQANGDFREMQRSANGLYYITEGANAVLSGKVIQTVDCGTHTLFIADVTEAKILSKEPSVTYAYYFAHIKPKPLPAAMSDAPKKGWICKICGYVYEGEDLPADFICPICKHGVADFEKLG